jgi:hypothetical protein
MALDAALESAIKQAVEEQGQPQAVAQRLLAWIEALGQGNAAPESQDGFYSRLFAEVVNPGDAT